MQGFRAFSPQMRSSHDVGPPFSYDPPHLDFPLPETPQVRLRPQSLSPQPSTSINRRRKEAPRCWHCTNDRRKVRRNALGVFQKVRNNLLIMAEEQCEPSSDSSSCERCKTIGYTCLLDAPGKAKRRKLSRWKCQRCREKKQKA